MPDLSKVQGRTDTQDRVLVRSDSILHTPRVTEVPPVTAAPDMRDAERGSQAGQLREVLGMTEQATASLVALDQQNFAETEKQNAQVAAADSVNGTPNADLMQKSEAYRMVIAGGRADAALATAEAEARINVLAGLAQSAGADPTRGDQVFGLDEANKVVEDTFRAHTLDAQGNPVDFGDSSANVRLYRGLAQVREHVLGIAAETIRAQEQSKATDALSNMVQSDLIRGDGGTIERNLQQASTLGLDRSLTKAKFLAATLDAAMSSKTIEPLSRALASTGADGSPTWSPEEQSSLLEAQQRLGIQFEEQRRVATERVAHATLGNWSLDIAAGKLRLTPDMVRQANANGQLDPQFNDQAFQLQHRFDAEQQQKIQWGREAATYARSSQIQTMELQSLKAKQQAQSIIGSAMAGGLNGTQLTATLIKNRASMDSEAFNDAMEFAKSIPSDHAYVLQTHAGDHLIELNAFLQSVAHARSQMQAAHKPVISDQQWSAKVTLTQFKFFNSLRTGANPDEALRSAILSTGVSDQLAQTWVSKATTKHTSLSVKDLLGSFGGGSGGHAFAPPAPEQTWVPLRPVINGYHMIQHDVFGQRAVPNVSISQLFSEPNEIAAEAAEQSPRN